jgi:hypothetical protein
MRAHFTAIGLFVQCVECDPPRGGLGRAREFAAGKLDLGQAIEDQAQATAPDFALEVGPIVEARRNAERKAGEELAAVTGRGRLQVRQAGGPSAARRDRPARGRAGRLVGALDGAESISTPGPARAPGRDREVGGAGLRPVGRGPPGGGRVLRSGVAAAGLTRPQQGRQVLARLLARSTAR